MMAGRRDVVLEAWLVLHELRPRGAHLHRSVKPFRESDDGSF